MRKFLFLILFCLLYIGSTKILAKQCGAKHGGKSPIRHDTSNFANINRKSEKMSNGFPNNSRARPTECESRIGQSCTNSGTSSLIKQTSPLDPSKITFSNRIDTRTRQVTFSAAYVDGNNRVKIFDRPPAVSWCEELHDPECLGEHQQGYCRDANTYTGEESWKIEDYVSSRYRERGQLIPVKDYLYDEKALKNTYSCANSAPQDKWTNTIWKNGPEITAMNYRELYGDGLILTGTCKRNLVVEDRPIPSPDPEAPGSIPTKFLDVPSCFWKLVAVLECNENGDTECRVGGWVGSNHEPAWRVRPSDTNECSIETQNIHMTRNYSDVLNQAGYTSTEMYQFIRDAGITSEESSCFSSALALPLPDLKEHPKVCESQDQTRVPMARGEAVVTAVVQMLKKSNIFFNDFELLKRTALVQSNFGMHPNLFEDESFIGIWGITSDELNSTIARTDPTILAKIQDKFGIDWSQVTTIDMLKPLFSGIAAAIKIQSAIIEIPQAKQALTIEKQSFVYELLFLAPSFYQDIQEKQSERFNTTVHNYYRDNPIRGTYDLIVVLDGSGSIGQTDFNTAKQVVGNILSSMKAESISIRLGLILYSTLSQVIFDFDNNMTPHQLMQAAMSMNYPGGGTNTDKGINDAIAMFRTKGNSVPHMTLVLTDGKSSNAAATRTAAAESSSLGITTFAVGIGSGINSAELQVIAGGIERYVFQTSLWEDLKEMPLWLNAHTAMQPNQPSFNETTADIIVKNEVRYYKVATTSRSVGVTIEVTDVVGTTRRFMSYSESNPSSVIHDKEFGDGFQYFEPVPEDQGFLYFSIEGQDEENSFTVKTYQGFVEGCGLRGADSEIINVESVPINLPEGAIIWSTPAYGYENSKNARNARYVEQLVIGTELNLVAKPRFQQYIIETGETTMNVTTSFRCTDNSQKVYTIVLHFETN